MGANKYSSVIAASTSSDGKKIMDSPNLRLEFCDSCDLFLGGLFPVHAPKYARQTVTVPVTPADKSTGYKATNIIDLENLVTVTGQHREHDEGYSSVSCGEIKKERGIQRLEAMLFAIDLINSNSSLLPHMRLGARVFDTCDRDTIALEKCVHFVSDYFLLKDDSIVNDFGCSANGSAPSMMKAFKKKDVINRRKVVGVIGAASSSVSIQVANLLRLFQVVIYYICGQSKEMSQSHNQIQDQNYDKK